MYISRNQAWCRATYAMEVFASMLNKGDILQIYPMWPIIVNGQTYSMEKPLEITDSSQANIIRGIFTEDAGETPIESVDCAIAGLKTLKADKKYMIVLTDGGSFYKNGHGLTKDRTVKELDKRVEESAGPAMTFMYLGIGSDACMPASPQSEYFHKTHAKNSEDVLSSLTVMCNQVFGRDRLPDNHISGNTIDFDISMKKLIVFVQGENIGNLKLTGGNIGQPAQTQQTKYSEGGADDYPSYPDTSLQGMMVTYTNCSAGTYTIEYTGTPTSVEVYYEPDADLDFVFTRASGGTVDPNALYEGDYKVSFGIKDAKTGKLISSDLLGKPHYEGEYYINDKAYPISLDGYSGEVPVSLEMGDSFDAKLTVTYLSGYTITKDSSDFGWPEGGIQVAAIPAGELTLEITGGENVYSLQNLTEGAPFIAKVYYEGEQLTGNELKNVELEWYSETSNAEIKKNFADDHWELHLGYKNPEAPQDTVCGECTVDIYAVYAAKGASEAQAQCPVTYNIIDDFSPLQISMYAPDDYIVISELADSRPIEVALTINGQKLTAEDFAAVDLQVDCGGLDYTLSTDEQNSCFLIQLEDSGNIKDDDYLIRVTADYTDHIGRVTQAEDSLKVTLSDVPLWVKWAVTGLLLLILLIVLWIILHIKVLPKKARTTKKLSSMNFDGEDVTNATNFLAEIKKKGAKVQAKYGGKVYGVSMDVSPGRESYLYKPQKRRSALVKPLSVKKFGPAKVLDVMIGSTKYVADEDTGKLVPAIPNQKPFPLTNGAMVKISGTVNDAGTDKDFEVVTKYTFK